MFLRMVYPDLSFRMRNSQSQECLKKECFALANGLSRAHRPHVHNRKHYSLFPDVAQLSSSEFNLRTYYFAQCRQVFIRCAAKFIVAPQCKSLGMGVDYLLKTFA